MTEEVLLNCYLYVTLMGSWFDNEGTCIHLYSGSCLFLFDCCDQLPLESAYNLFADTTELHPFDVTTHAIHENTFH